MADTIRNNENDESIVYIGVINNSDSDRVDIVRVSTDKEAVLNDLYEAYKELVKEDRPSPEPDTPTYGTIEAFEMAAAQDLDSAYIQYPRSHVNFELHEAHVERGKTGRDA